MTNHLFSFLYSITKKSNTPDFFSNEKEKQYNTIEVFTRQPIIYVSMEKNRRSPPWVKASVGSDREGINVFASSYLLE